jgi:hypothetical protein
MIEIILGLTLLFGDSVGRRSQLCVVLYGGFALFGWALVSGLFLKSFPVHDVEFPMLHDVVSVNTRVLSSAVNLAVFLTRFAVTTVRSSGRLVLLPGLRNVKVLRSVAEDICKAYSLQARRVAAAVESGGAAGAVAPCPQRRVVLADVAAGVLRDASDDGSAAKAALVAALDDLSEVYMEQHRRATVTLRQEIAARWEHHDEDAYERVLIPHFVPLVVDSRRTIAAALAGASLSDVCYSVCRSPAFSWLQVLIVPSGFSVNVYVLWGRGSGAAVYVMYAVIAAAFLLNCFQVLLFNTEVLRKVVLPRFDTFWAFANILLVAVTGAFVFENPQHKLVWAAAQVQTSLYLFQDAAPQSRRARRIVSLSFAGYAVYQIASVFAIWQRFFGVSSYFVTFLGQSVDLKHWLFAAQVNASINATRFAFRALSDERYMIFCAGLQRVRMSAADARELRALMLAEQDLGEPRRGQNILSR